MLRRSCRRASSARIWTRSFASRFESGSSIRNATRLAHHRPPHRHALPLAARQLRRLAVQQRLEAQDLRDVVDPALVLVLRRLPQAQPEPEVLVDGHVRVEGVVLEDHRDVSILRRQIGDLLAVDEELAGGDLLQARQDPEDRGLAAPGRADEDHELAVLDLQRDVVHGDHVVAEDLRDAVEDDLRHRSTLLPSRPSVRRRDDRGSRSRGAARLRSRRARRRRSSPISAAPTTGGAVSGTIEAAGAHRASRPSRMRSKNESIAVAEDPAAEHDCTSSFVMRRRRIAVPAIVTISSAWRSTISRATASPVDGRLEHDGRQLGQALVVDPPEVHRLRQLPRARRSPKCAGPPFAARSSGPRPSSDRTACHAARLADLARRRPSRRRSARRPGTG